MGGIIRVKICLLSRAPQHTHNFVKGKKRSDRRAGTAAQGSSETYTSNVFNHFRRFGETDRHGYGNDMVRVAETAGGRKHPL